MTPAQHLWSALFNFGPAIILGIYKQWWVAIIALVASFLLSRLLFLVVSINIPVSAMGLWAWIKGPVVAAIILSLGHWFF